MEDHQDEHLYENTSRELNGHFAVENEEHGYFNPVKLSEPGTGLLRAARAGNLDKVLEYLKANVDINTCNANGLNALHLASKDGHINVVQELLERGASVDAATRKGNTSLHIAALAGQEDVVRLLVQNGGNVNVQSQNGFTCLYMAAQENHDNVVKFLLANGANQALATEDGFTPLAVAMQQGHDKVVALLLESDVRGKVRLPALHIAAKKDDCKAATLLLQNSANPDVTSKSNFTPLHIAAHYGNHEVAELLLDRGADVNFPAKHQITPLHVAAKWGKSHLAALLIERGANIDAKTRDGLTPLHCSARSGHEQLVDVLLEKGAPMSAKTKNGLAALHMSAQGDHVDAARILLYHKAPVDDVTVDYLTALHVAAHCGHVRVAKLLLDRKADPNSRALNGFTPLHIACKKNRIKVVELLLKSGAQIEATTESGLTPLHVASFMGCMNIAIFLLQNGSKPDATTVRGETPLHLAARANQTDIVRILLRNGASVDARAKEEQTPLHIAARLGNCDLVMLLLQHGASADAATKEMYTSLHIAAKEGQEEVAAILLDKGANVAAPTKRGFTPLHLSAKHGHVKVANLLLSKGAPVNAAGKNDLTPLHLATHHHQNPVALMLLDNGADAKCVAKNGYTPLHVASKHNQIDIATALIEYGADVNAVSRAGFTPVHLAAGEGHADIVTLLIQHGAESDVGSKNGLRPLHLAAQEDRVPAANILVNMGGATVDPATQSGYTPLHVASHFGQAAMVRYLLQNGANVRSVTSAGNTPLHHAAQQGQTLIITLLLEKKADPDSSNTAGQTPLAIAEKLGYVSVVETLKIVTTHTTTKTTTTTIEERYKVLAPESMVENLASDSEDEGTDDAGNESYRYLTVDDMKSLGDDSLPIDVTRDEQHHRDSGYLNLMEENVVAQSYSKNSAAPATDNVDISRSPIQIGFLVSFMVDARGGAMRGCRHSGVRIIIPPRKAPSPMRITCRYLRKDRLVHPPPLMEGEALASRVLELGPIGVKFLGPVILEVPHFAALRSHEREIIVLRSDNGEAWKEHTLDSSEEALNDVFNESFDSNEMKQLDEFKTNRITRIVTHDFPQYFALVSRIRQEVHAVGPEGGMVSSSVVPQVQAVFPSGALTKRIKVGLQAHPISAELINKVAGSRVSVSPIVTVEPRRRKFHKPITLSIPVPKSQDPNSSLRLLCSITGVFRKRSVKGGTTRAQWEDVTGSTPLTFVNDCVSFTTTVSARFWLVDCRHASHEVTRMATDLYREAIHVPFMAKFVIFAKRIETNEARLRVFCMTDDREEKTLEGQENFMEVAKSRDVEVLEGKPQWIEMAGNLAPVTKSGEQLRLKFYAFRENRLPFLVRLRDVGAGAVGRIMFMRESRSSGKNDQTPVCNLNIVLPEELLPDDPSAPASMASSPRQVHNNRYNAKSVVYSALPKYLTPGDGEIHKADLRISDVANLLGDDWIPLSQHLGIADQDVSIIETEYPDSPYQQATVMLRLWMQQAGDRASGNNLEKALNSINRGDIVSKCIGNLAPVTDVSEKLIAQTHVKESKTSGDIIHPAMIKTEKKLLSLDVSYDEPDIMKDSESLEDVSQQELARNKAKLESAKNTMMTSSYEREEQKYVAEEKEKTGPNKLRLVTWKIDNETPSHSKSDDSAEVKVERSETESPMSMSASMSASTLDCCDTGISLTLLQDMDGIQSDTEGEVSELSLTLASPVKTMEGIVAGSEGESSDSDTVKPDLPSTSHSIIEELYLDEPTQSTPAQYVDKASSPVRILDSDEGTSKGQGIDVSVGTDPKDARSQYVLTNLHDIVTLPLEDSEIYHILQNKAHPKESRDLDEKDEILSPIRKQEEASPIQETKETEVTQTQISREVKQDSTIISSKKTQTSVEVQKTVPADTPATPKPDQVVETASQIIRRLESVTKLTTGTESSKIQLDSTPQNVPDSKKTPSPKSPEITEQKISLDDSKVTTVTQISKKATSSEFTESSSKTQPGSIPQPKTDSDSKKISSPKSPEITEQKISSPKSPEITEQKISPEDSKLKTVTKFTQQVEFESGKKLTKELKTDTVSRETKIVQQAGVEISHESSETHEKFSKTTAVSKKTEKTEETDSHVNLSKESETKKPAVQALPSQKSLELTETEKIRSPIDSSLHKTALEERAEQAKPIQIPKSASESESEKILTQEQSFESTDISDATVCSTLEDLDSQDILSPKSDDLTATDKTIFTEGSPVQTESEISKSESPISAQVESTEPLSPDTKTDTVEIEATPAEEITGKLPSTDKDLPSTIVKKSVDAVVTEEKKAGIAVSSSQASTKKVQISTETHAIKKLPLKSIPKEAAKPGKEVAGRKLVDLTDKKKTELADKSPKEPRRGSVEISKSVKSVSQLTAKFESKSTQDVKSKPLKSKVVETKFVPGGKLSSTVAKKSPVVIKAKESTPLPVTRQKSGEVVKIVSKISSSPESAQTLSPEQLPESTDTSVPEKTNVPKSDELAVAEAVTSPEPSQKVDTTRIVEVSQSVSQVEAEEKLLTKTSKVTFASEESKLETKPGKELKDMTATVSLEKKIQDSKKVESIETEIPKIHKLDEISSSASHSTSKVEYESSHTVTAVTFGISQPAAVPLTITDVAPKDISAVKSIELTDTVKLDSSEEHSPKQTAEDISKSSPKEDKLFRAGEAIKPEEAKTEVIAISEAVSAATETDSATTVIKKSAEITESTATVVTTGQKFDDVVETAAQRLHRLEYEIIRSPKKPTEAADISDMSAKELDSAKPEDLTEPKKTIDLSQQETPDISKSIEQKSVQLESGSSEEQTQSLDSSHITAAPTAAVQKLKPEKDIPSPKRSEPTDTEKIVLSGHSEATTIISQSVSSITTQFETDRIISKQRDTKASEVVASPETAKDKDIPIRISGDKPITAEDTLSPEKTSTVKTEKVEIKASEIEAISKVNDTDKDSKDITSGISVEPVVTQVTLSSESTVAEKVKKIEIQESQIAAASEADKYKESKEILSKISVEPVVTQVTLLSEATETEKAEKVEIKASEFEKLSSQTTAPEKVEKVEIKASETAAVPSKTDEVKESKEIPGIISVESISAQATLPSETTVTVKAEKIEISKVSSEADKKKDSKEIPSRISAESIVSQATICSESTVMGKVARFVESVSETSHKESKSALSEKQIDLSDKWDFGDDSKDASKPESENLVHTDQHKTISPKAEEKIATDKPMSMESAISSQEKLPEKVTPTEVKPELADKKIPQVVKIASADLDAKQKLEAIKIAKYAEEADKQSDSFMTQTIKTSETAAISEQDLKRVPAEQDKYSTTSVEATEPASFTIPAGIDIEQSIETGSKATHSLKSSEAPETESKYDISDISKSESVQAATSSATKTVTHVSFESISSDSSQRQIGVKERIQTLETRPHVDEPEVPRKIFRISPEKARVKLPSEERVKVIHSRLPSEEHSLLSLGQTETIPQSITAVTVEPESHEIIQSTTTETSEVLKLSTVKPLAPKEKVSSASQEISVKQGAHVETSVQPILRGTAVEQVSKTETLFHVIPAQAVAEQEPKDSKSTDVKPVDSAVTIQKQASVEQKQAESKIGDTKAETLVQSIQQQAGAIITKVATSVQQQVSVEQQQTQARAAEGKTETSVQKMASIDQKQMESKRDDAVEISVSDIQKQASVEQIKSETSIAKSTSTTSVQEFQKQVSVEQKETESKIIDAKVVSSAHTIQQQVSVEQKPAGKIETSVQEIQKQMSLEHKKAESKIVEAKSESTVLTEQKPSEAEIVDVEVVTSVQTIEPVSIQQKPAEGKIANVKVEISAQDIQRQVSLERKEAESKIVQTKSKSTVSIEQKPSEAEIVDVEVVPSVQTIQPVSIQQKAAEGKIADVKGEISTQDIQRQVSLELKEGKSKIIDTKLEASAQEIQPQLPMEQKETDAKITDTKAVSSAETAQQLASIEKQTEGITAVAEAGTLVSSIPQQTSIELKETPGKIDNAEVGISPQEIKRQVSIEQKQVDSKVVETKSEASAQKTQQIERRETEAKITDAKLVSSVQTIQQQQPASIELKQTEGITSGAELETSVSHIQKQVSIEQKSAKPIVSDAEIHTSAKGIQKQASVEQKQAEARISDAKVVSPIKVIQSQASIEQKQAEAIIVAPELQTSVLQQASSEPKETEEKSIDGKMISSVPDFQKQVSIEQIPAHISDAEIRTSVQKIEEQVSIEQKQSESKIVETKSGASVQQIQKQVSIEQKQTDAKNADAKVVSQVQTIQPQASIEQKQIEAKTDNAELATSIREIQQVSMQQKVTVTKAADTKAGSSVQEIQKQVSIEQKQPESEYKFSGAKVETPDREVPQVSIEQKETQAKTSDAKVISPAQDIQKQAYIEQKQAAVGADVTTSVSRSKATFEQSESKISGAKVETSVREIRQQVLMEHKQSSVVMADIKTVSSTQNIQKQALIDEKQSEAKITDADVATSVQRTQASIEQTESEIGGAKVEASVSHDVKEAPIAEMKHKSEAIIVSKDSKGSSDFVDHRVSEEIQSQKSMVKTVETSESDSKAESTPHEDSLHSDKKELKSVIISTVTSVSGTDMHVPPLKETHIDQVTSPSEEIASEFAAKVEIDTEMHTLKSSESASEIPAKPYTSVLRRSESEGSPEPTKISPKVQRATSEIYTEELSKSISFDKLTKESDFAVKKMEYVQGEKSQTMSSSAEDLKPAIKSGAIGREIQIPSGAASESKKSGSIVSKTSGSVSEIEKIESVSFVHTSFKTEPESHVEIHQLSPAKDSESLSTILEEQSHESGSRISKIPGIVMERRRIESTSSEDTSYGQSPSAAAASAASEEQPIVQETIKERFAVVKAAPELQDPVEYNRKLCQEIVTESADTTELQFDLEESELESFEHSLPLQQIPKGTSEKILKFETSVESQGESDMTETFSSSELEALEEQIIVKTSEQGMKSSEAVQAQTKYDMPKTFSSDEIEALEEQIIVEKRSTMEEPNAKRKISEPAELALKMAEEYESKMFLEQAKLELLSVIDQLDTFEPSAPLLESLEEAEPEQEISNITPPPESRDSQDSKSSGSEYERSPFHEPDLDSFTFTTTIDSSQRQVRQFEDSEKFKRTSVTVFQSKRHHSLFSMENVDEPGETMFRSKSAPAMMASELIIPPLDIQFSIAGQISTEFGPCKSTSFHDESGLMPEEPSTKTGSSTSDSPASSTSRQSSSQFSSIKFSNSTTTQSSAHSSVPDTPCSFQQQSGSTSSYRVESYSGSQDSGSSSYTRSHSNSESSPGLSLSSCHSHSKSSSSTSSGSNEDQGLTCRDLVSHSSEDNPTIVEIIMPIINFNFVVGEFDTEAHSPTVENSKILSGFLGRSSAEPLVEPGGGGGPVHGEVKLLVRSSGNGRGFVEITSLREGVLTPPPAPKSPVQGSQSPDSPVDEASVMTQKLVVRFHGASADTTSSRSGPPEATCTQTLTKKTVRMVQLPSADSEETCSELPLSGSYTFSEIPRRKEDIEKEALILDDFERQAELELASALAQANQTTGSQPPAPLEKSEVEGSEKYWEKREVRETQVFNTAEATDAATRLVGEIESNVQQRLGMVVTPSVPSSVEITDEELLSTGDVSSPEFFKPVKASTTAKASVDCETPEGLIGVSSSSSEFFTAREDNTLKSSSDDQTRPKSWDSSLICQFPSSGSGSEYQTAVNPSSSQSSSRSYLGNLSSASGSGTLVASQIDLDSCMDEEDEQAPDVETAPQLPTSRSVQVGEESPNLLESRLPVTLTSSTSGTTVCTQVETTYEARVQGDPEVDDQDGNTEIYDDAELANLFLNKQSSLAVESPEGMERRPLTPEPPRLLHFNEASQLEELFNTEYCTTDSLPYSEPIHKLEDIEEEGSLKNSPKSVLSLEMSGTSLESSGERQLGRPVSRESSSSLNEFERLESALLEEDSKKDPLLSEIEEGHESQVSEGSDETEICGEEPIECEMEFDWDSENLVRPEHSSDSPHTTTH